LWSFSVIRRHRKANSSALASVLARVNAIASVYEQQRMAAKAYFGPLEVNPKKLKIAHRRAFQPATE
jgi:hypothetical protein